MRILIDTCSFLWFISDSPKLSKYGKELIEDSNNDIFISLASIWEMGIKYSIGKLNFSKPFDIFIREQLVLNNIEILPINLEHIIVISTLPLYHRDPFDRLMISQAIFENLPIISSDSNFDSYSIKRLW